MNIMINTFPYRITRGNTDIIYNWNLFHLGKQFNDLFLISANATSSIIAGYVAFLLNAFARRLGLLRKRVFYYWCHASIIPIHLLKQKRIDVVFTNCEFPVNLDNTEIPIVWKTGFTQELDKRIISREVEIAVKREFGNRSSIINLPTETSAERFAELLPELRRKIRVIPHYLPYIEPVSTDEIEKKQKADREKINILFVGNAARGKGLPQLLDAICHLDADKRKRMNVTVVSNFSDGAVDLSKLDQIRALSNLPHCRVLDLMRQSHIFAFPTRIDAYGHVVIEAMASGCAVLTSNRDPQNLFVDYGRAGMLVNPAQPSDICTKLKQLLENEELRRELAYAAYRRYLERYHYSVVGDAYRQMFFNACNGNLL